MSFGMLQAVQAIFADLCQSLDGLVLPKHCTVHKTLQPTNILVFTYVIDDAMRRVHSSRLTQGVEIVIFKRDPIDNRKLVAAWNCIVRASILGAVHLITEPPKTGNHLHALSNLAAYTFTT